MEEALVPYNESDRLRALEELEVLDSAAEPEFDALVRAASAVTGTPISLISLVDRSRQWFKASVGLGDVTETGRDIAFCSHAILGDEPFEVRDAAADHRFQDNPLVAGDPGIRFYCGVPIKLAGGERVGTLCVIDRVPRELDEMQLEVLTNLAVAAKTALEGRKATRTLRVKSLALIESEHALLQANYQLSQANDELRTFVRVASHDLKSPMITIGRLAEWTLEDLGEDVPEPVKQHVHLIQSRVARIECLLDDLRRYATLGSEKAPLQELAVEDLLRRNFELHDGSHAVELVIESELDGLIAQAAPLEMVIRNLFGNAIKHGKCAAPKVVASVRSLGDAVEFSISDNGPGIEPQFHSVVFEMLRSLKPRDQVEGSGMGLALVQKAVNQAGGTISLESDGVRGTTFRFHWPCEPIREYVAGTA